MNSFKIWLENELDLSYLLAGPGEVPQIGPEESYPAFVQNGSVKYISPHGSYRYIYFIDGKPVSALQIVSKNGRDAIVSNVYTIPEYRRMGYAKKLFDRAKSGFKNLKHSKDLSVLGSLWANKIN